LGYPNDCRLLLLLPELPSERALAVLLVLPPSLLASCAPELAYPSETLQSFVLEPLVLQQEHWTAYP
jgi:hypothetical protein